MLENRDDAGTEGVEPAGVEDDDDADEQEGEESASPPAFWRTFFRPWRITTNVSKPRAALTTSFQKGQMTICDSAFEEELRANVYVNSSWAQIHFNLGLLTLSCTM